MRRMRLKSLFPDRRKDLPFSLNVFGMGFDLSQMEQADLIHLHWIGGRTLDFSRLGRIRRPLVHTLHDLFACTAGCHCPLECTGFHEGCRGKCPQLGTPVCFRACLHGCLTGRKKHSAASVP